MYVRCGALGAADAGLEKAPAAQPWHDAAQLPNTPRRSLTGDAPISRAAFLDFELLAPPLAIGVRSPALL